MQKSGKKQRDIKFRSEKCGEILQVHSEKARAYARLLEQTPNVERYVTGKALDLERLNLIQKVDIRGSFFTQQWETDFYILYQDGSIAVRELVNPGTLNKLSEIEKLELSRRYWKFCGVEDWKLVIMGDTVCF